MKNISCSYPECTRKYYAKGFCQPHYDQVRRGVPLGPIKEHRTTCEYPECGRKHYSKGLCKAHHQQQWMGKKLVPVGLPRSAKTQIGECIAPNCNASKYVQGLCKVHYQRSLKFRLKPESLVQLLSQDQCSNRHCDNPATNIDHCHTTGMVRGRLCWECNVILGFAQDSPERLQGLIEYLNSPYPHLEYRLKVVK